ncbi:MAG: YeiH family protein [Thiovulaceae bacterium]|nr:YeiH family protein [Sulfurimonadaceae bacterium]
MPFSPEKRQGTINGIIFVAIFATAATFIASIPAVAALHISPLVIGIVLGIFYANTLGNQIPQAWETGITFSGKKILRFAIVFYGFNLTFQQIAEVGMAGFTVSVVMLTTTFLIGTYAGIKWFKMDRETSMLTASGAAVCGAAAVAATEPVLKAESHKVGVAVGMVVLFGTIAMFLYPLIYPLLDMNPSEFGIYVGGTIHEVAQVVAVPASIPGGSEVMANNAVIVKMTRVMLIAPMLIILSLYISYQSKKEGSEGTKVPLVIPWFAVYFVGMAGINSLDLIPANIVQIITTIDTFLLTVAMTALGMNTRFSKFKELGAAPLLTATVMFGWLVIGGYFVTKWAVAAF